MDRGFRVQPPDQGEAFECEGFEGMSLKEPCQVFVCCPGQKETREEVVSRLEVRDGRKPQML